MRVPATIGNRIFHCFDNFHTAPFFIKGKQYLSSECYFQAMKARHEGGYELVRQAEIGKMAWEAGSAIPLREDWENGKVRVMYEANLDKFRQNASMMKELLETTEPIKFGLDYNGLFVIPMKTFWLNWSSRILTRIRAELRDQDFDVQNLVLQIEEQFQDYQKSTM